ncbi:trichohyalin-like isoform X2 [Aphidius gifuensis]|nr:trichohyalin-like isoform X2 [Aphidius gifuensis]XP_044008270.1 trichohyalin-like isoform X2 [Aphidius gifuensis]
MTKNWTDTFKSKKEKHRRDILSKKEDSDEARLQFIKELTAKNAEERAEIVNEARKLLFYKKPHCRLINSALLTSECYRELNAQIEFNKKLQNVDKQQDKEYADILKKDTENFINEEKQKIQNRMIKIKTYGDELKKQINETNNNLKEIEMTELRSDQEALINMNKELQLIEQCEAEQIIKKKEEIKKLFLDSLEEKRRREEKIKVDEDLENRAIQAYKNTKSKLNKITKEKLKKEQIEKIQRTEYLAKKCAIIYESNDDAEEERLRKAIAEKDEIENKKIEAKRNFAEKMKNDILKYHSDIEELKKKKADEEKNLIAWETLQRYKRNEFNEENKLKQLQEEWKKKIDMREYLKKQMEEQEAINNHEKVMNDESKEVKQAIDKTNNKVLAYGQEVLEESKGVRPLFPIIKAIEQFKKENNLLPRKTFEIEEEEEDSPLARKRNMKKICSNPLSPDKIFYLG